MSNKRIKKNKMENSKKKKIKVEKLNDESDKYDCEIAKKKKFDNSEDELTEMLDKIRRNMKREDQNVKEEVIKRKKKKILSDNDNSVKSATEPNEEADYTTISPPKKKMKNMKKVYNNESELKNDENLFVSDTKVVYNENEKNIELLNIGKKLKNKKHDMKENDNFNEKSARKRGLCKKEEDSPKKKRAKKDQKKEKKTKDGTNEKGIEENASEGEVTEGQTSNTSKKKKKKKNKAKTVRFLKENSKKSKKLKTKNVENEHMSENKKPSLYNESKENIKMTFDVTNRFTVLGCDWDNISSVDIFYLFESYYNFEKKKKKKIDYNKSRAVKKVTIYTSKYGEKKLKYEQEHGPLINFNLLKAKGKNEEAVYRKSNFIDCMKDELSEVHEEETEGEKGEYEEGKLAKKKSKGKASSEENTSISNFRKAKEINSFVGTSVSEHEDENENEKIRLYQIQRSRYYFALVECYNKEIVEFLYEELNDMDADFCMGYLDLRIIDDNCSLDDYVIKETCDKIPENYEFHYSVTTALKHTNVKPAWDENPKRKKLLSTRFTEEKLRELDLKEYLANSSSEDEEEEYDSNLASSTTDGKRSKEDYRKLLLGDLSVDGNQENEKVLHVDFSPSKESGDNVYNDNEKGTGIYEEDEEDDDDEDDEEDDDNDYGRSDHESNGKKLQNKMIINKDSDTSSVEEGKSNKGASSKNQKGNNLSEHILKNRKQNSEKNKGKANGESAELDNDSDKENEIVKVFRNMLVNKEQKEEKKNPWSQYLEKIREKKKLKKKAHMEALKKKDDEIKKIITRKTNKRKKETAVKNLGDNVIEKVKESHLIDGRFTDLLKNKDFNLDVTNPKYKKTKFNENILQKKL
ncbi:small subunit rRNA processing factor, putative [Plasmodium ovale curtisi]|uniref:Small subunit rRNA processing factor, putative n=1 Tax=Plasmodium ovale curtisi TaxID=864141 RepID=A0A1A8W291_PLAOA|nr:small subunit rRNA processing factor, putative [Plasmodium ovale curtisi]